MVMRTVGGTKRKIFLSYDLERDRENRDFFLRQGRQSDATWHVGHMSEYLNENDPSWLPNTTRRIKECQAVIVLLGSHTYGAPGVLKEVAVAEMLDKPIFQIIPYGAGQPHTIPNAGRVIRWQWDNVKQAIASAGASKATGQTTYLVRASTG